MRELEDSLAQSDFERAITLADQLVARALANAAGLLGGNLEAPRDPATVALLLGLDGRRYLEFRALVARSEERPRRQRGRGPRRVRDGRRSAVLALTHPNPHVISGDALLAVSAPDVAALSSPSLSSPTQVALQISDFRGVAHGGAAGGRDGKRGGCSCPTRFARAATR